MSKTNLKKTPFTPLLDSLVDEFGIVTAAVFGRVWRYCQMERGYCHAEQSRIAEELNISRETVNRSIKELVKCGYLVDTTPNTKGRTRIYKDTGKAGVSLLPEPMTEPVNEAMTEPVNELVTISHTKTEKKEKIFKTPTTTVSSVVEEFLKNSDKDQEEAYRLVKRFSSEEKAIEVASREHPLEAARDYLEWCAENMMSGGNTARAILSEIEHQEHHEQAILNFEDNVQEAQDEFITALRESLGYTPEISELNELWKRWQNENFTGDKYDFFQDYIGISRSINKFANSLKENAYA